MPETFGSVAPHQEHPEVSEAERLKRELETIDKEYEEKGITPGLRTVFSFMLGYRPAGGPYELTISDDNRFKTSKEYTLGMKLTEYPEDGEGQVVVNESVLPDLISTFQDLETRRWQTVVALNKARGIIEE